MNTFSPANSNSSVMSGSTLGEGALKAHPKKIKRKKEMRKALFFVIFSVILLALYSIYFFLPQLSIYLKSPDEIQVIESEIENYENVILPQLETQKDLNQAAYEEDFERFNEALDQVFPVGLDKARIVETLERFALAADSKFPEFRLTGVTIGETREENGYQVTDVSIRIDNDSSLEAFNAFLELVDSSGRLDLVEEDDQDNDSSVPVSPLMSINDFNVTYEEDQGKVDFSARLLFYSRLEQ